MNEKELDSFSGTLDSRITVTDLTGELKFDSGSIDNQVDEKSIYLLLKILSKLR